jgi:hypothetical protein
MSRSHNCPQCNAIIPGNKGAMKEHFKENHKEFHFYLESNKLICEICKKNVATYFRLAKWHNHNSQVPEDKNIAPVSGFPFLRNIVKEISAVLDRNEYLEKRVKELIEISEKRTVQVLEAQKLLENIR